MPHAARWLSIATLGRNLGWSSACSDPSADNYDQRSFSASNCVAPPKLVCTDPAASNNYVGADRTAATTVSAPWLCRYTHRVCQDPAAANYRATISADEYISTPSMCQFAGCNDTMAKNFDSRATFNDGTCTYHQRGCMDPASATFSAHYDETCAWASPPPITPPPPSPPVISRGSGSFLSYHVSECTWSTVYRA